MTTSTAQQDETAHYKAILRDIIDMAADLARMVHTQAHRANEASTAALPPTPGHPGEDPTIPFTRIAGTIRRTILLAQHLDKPRQPRDSHRIAVRKRILRDVEDHIQRNAEPRDKEPLRLELQERLDAPDLEDDIDTRPIADIILDLCRDLRVVDSYSKNFQRRTPEAIECLRTRAAALPNTWTRGEIHRQAPSPKPTFHLLT